MNLNPEPPHPRSANTLTGYHYGGGFICVKNTDTRPCVTCPSVHHRKNMLNCKKCRNAWFCSTCIAAKKHGKHTRDFCAQAIQEFCYASGVCTSGNKRRKCCFIRIRCADHPFYHWVHHKAATPPGTPWLCCDGDKQLFENKYAFLLQAERESTPFE